jgi:hypothetical protein
MDKTLGESLADDGERIAAEVRAVIKVMQKYYPKMDDYDVVGDDEVEILNEEGEVLKVITCDQLTDHWNEMEGMGILRTTDLTVFWAKEDSDGN